MNYDEETKDIYVSDQELDGLFAAWNSRVGRPPNEQEIFNIVNDYIKLFIIVCEKLSSCPRAQNRGRKIFFKKIIIFRTFFSLYSIGYLNRFYLYLPR